MSAYDSYYNGGMGQQSQNSYSTPWTQGGGQGNTSYVQTSINPRTTYDPWMTQSAVNQGVGALDKTNNLYSMFKKMDRPQSNFYRGPATMGRLTAPLAQYGAQRNSMMQGVPLQDAYTNQQSVYNGQMNRENEALGLAQNQANQESQQWGQNFNNLSMFGGMLQQLLAG